MPNRSDRQLAWLDRHGVAWGLAALIVLVSVIYYPGAKGPFMLDDFSNLLGNRHIYLTELSMAGLEEAAFSNRSGPLRRPVSMVSFALSHYFAGAMEPFAIKIVNIVVHVLTTLLLFFLSRHLLARIPAVDLRPGILNGISVQWAALLITALWALHPLHVSTVLYAVQRMTGLAAMFTILGALLYVQGRACLLAGRLNAACIRIGSGIAGCGLLAIFSKETGALLPVLLLVIELVFYRFAVGPDITRSVRAALMLLLVLPSLAIVGYLIYVWVGPPGINPIRDFNPTERLLTQSRVLFFYLSQLAVPDLGRMSLFHGGVEVSRGLLQPVTTLTSILGMWLLIGVALYALAIRRLPAFAFAVFWFLGGHLLESTVMPLEMVFEHRNYLPSYGPLFALGYALTQSRLVRRLRPKVRYALPIVVVLALASPLQLRASYWSNISDFLVYELVSHPESPRVWVSLAYAEAQRGLFEDAAKFYAKAGELEPEEAGHLVGALSLHLHELETPPDATLLQQIFTRLEQHPVTVYTAGQLYRMGTYFRRNEGRDLEDLAIAAQVFARAVANDRWPTAEHHAASHFLLGELSLYLNKPFEAIQRFHEGLILRPDDVAVRLQLAELLFIVNRPAAARIEIQLIDAGALSLANQDKLAELKTKLLAANADPKKENTAAPQERKRGAMAPRYP